LYLDQMHAVEAFVNAYQGASVAAVFKGFNENVRRGNWIQTMPGKGYNTMLRLYSPLEPKEGWPANNSGQPSFAPIAV
jgi:hypothetical protein